MTCRIQFSRKNKKNISKCRVLKFLPSMQSVNQSYPQYNGRYYWDPKQKNHVSLLTNYCVKSKPEYIHYIENDHLCFIQTKMYHLYRNKLP